MDLALALRSHDSAVRFLQNRLSKEDYGVFMNLLQDEPPRDPRLLEPIANLELCHRTCCCLSNAGIRMVEELTEQTESSLLSFPRFGRKSLREVKEALAARGLTLRGN